MRFTWQFVGQKSRLPRGWGFVVACLKEGQALSCSSSANFMVKKIKGKNEWTPCEKRSCLCYSIAELLRVCFIYINMWVCSIKYSALPTHPLQSAVCLIAWCLDPALELPVGSWRFACWCSRAWCHRYSWTRIEAWTLACFSRRSGGGSSPQRDCRLLQRPSKSEMQMIKLHLPPQSKVSYIIHLQHISTCGPPLPCGTSAGTGADWRSPTSLPFHVWPWL